MDSWQPTGKLLLEVFVTPPPNSINYDGITSSVQRSDLQFDQGFNISQAAVYGISKLLNDTFTVPSRGRKINAYALWGRKNTYVPTAMQSLYSSSDIEATFATLAKSMTNNIRQNDDNGSVITGKAGTYLLLIRVQFWFLALPVIVTFATAMFLAAVIYHTHTSDLAVWTTNALPVVALGRTIGSPVFDMKENVRISVMEKKAKEEIIEFGKRSDEMLLHHLPLKKNSSLRHQHGGYEQITN